MNITKRTNKYDLFLLLLTGSLGFGELGGAFQLPRILALMLFPVIVSHYRSCLYYTKPAIIFFILFYAYSLFSMLWTPDIEEGVKELVYYPIHFLLLIEILICSKFAVNTLKSLSTGWLLSVMFCAVVAVWELTTGNHLGTDTTAEHAFYAGGLNRFTASATFGNYNGYVTFLCFSVPWLFYILLDDRVLVSKLTTLAVLITSSLIIIIDASRGGLLSLGIMIMVYFVFSKKDSGKTLIFLLLIVGFVYGVYKYGSDITTIIEARSSDGAMFSDDSRMLIWSNALNVFADTWGLGVGIGGLKKGIEPYAHGEIAITHNMFLEMLVQYGIIITLVFMSYLVNTFIKALKTERNIKIVLMMAYVAMPVYMIINSGYLLSPWLYVLIATIIVFTNYERIKSANKILRKTT